MKMKKLLLITLASMANAPLMVAMGEFTLEEDYVQRPTSGAAGAGSPRSDSGSETSGKRSPTLDDARAGAGTPASDTTFGSSGSTTPTSRTPSPSSQRVTIGKGYLTVEEPSDKEENEAQNNEWTEIEEPGRKGKALGKLGLYNKEEFTSDEIIKAYEAFIQNQKPSFMGSLLSTPKKDFYIRLGVNSDASEDEIKQAYKDFVLLLHPDKHKNNKEKVESIVKNLNEAYETLVDKDRRKAYDANKKYTGTHKEFN
ncbi:MAG: DnaJ domain-containing protein [Candidatus Dependentiae bacterium]|nr:DnaJ domain-containing protein [Candidatus Dependentiae bacterium]